MNILGPPGDAEWVFKSIGSGIAQQTVQLIPDAANEKRRTAGKAEIMYCLPSSPQIARQPDGVPIVRITLILERDPHPGEQNVSGLIRKGRVDFELDMNTPRSVLDSPELGKYEIRQLLPVDTQFWITAGTTGTKRTLVKKNSLALHISLHADLVQNEILELLEALDLDSSSAMKIEAEIKYRLADPGRHEKTMIDSPERSQEHTYDSIVITGKIIEVIGKPLYGYDHERFIRLLSPHHKTGEIRQTPWHYTHNTTSHSRFDIHTPNNFKIQVTPTKNGYESLSHRLKPNPKKPLITNALLGYQLIKPSSTTVSAPYQLILDDYYIQKLGSDSVRSLPIVHDHGASTWPDRKNAKKIWYAPTYRVATPSRNASIDESPFVFSYKRTGVTSDGRPALEAKVIFTAIKDISEETRIKIENSQNTLASAVAINNLSVNLVIPFMDNTDGQLKVHTLPASVSADGDAVEVKIQLLNDWARLCYGSLSSPGFQAKDIQLSFSYSYEAYIPIRKDIFKPVFDEKISITPLLKNTSLAVNKNETYVDAATTTIHLPGGKLSLHSHEGLTRSSTGRALFNITAASIFNKPSIIVRPPFKVENQITDFSDVNQYALVTLVHEEKTTVLFPCNEYGGLYAEEEDGLLTSVGCQDALQLGSTEYKQYEEITELSHSDYRVYRSLQQPGRFLILPSNYRITRFSTDAEERAFRPAILLYSTIDAESPENNQVVFDIILEPDISPYLRQQLQTSLLDYSSEVILDYPTEILSEVQYNWMVASQITEEPKTVITTDGAIRVTISSDFTAALLLIAMLENGGITGSIDFKLPDTSILHSSLDLSLTSITGPWDTGPLEVVNSRDGVLVINQIETPIILSSIEAVTDELISTNVPVNTILEPGESVQVELPIQDVTVYPIYSLSASTQATIEEIRSFVEDITINIIFLDLINHANHSLERISVFAKLQDMSDSITVSLDGDPGIGEVIFNMPLTRYLDQRIVLFQVTKFFQSGDSDSTPWLEWDLDMNGNVIDLSWVMIE